MFFYLVNRLKRYFPIKTNFYPSLLNFRLKNAKKAAKKPPFLSRNPDLG